MIGSPATATRAETMMSFLRLGFGLAADWVRPNLTSYLSSRQPLLWLLALGLGVTVGVAAIAFRESIGWFQLWWLGDTSEHVASAARNVEWYWIMAGPVLGGLAVGGLLQFLPQRRAGGVADVIEARALSGRTLSARNGAIAAGITALSLGSGASAGREGPVVHLGASIAASASRRFALPGWASRTLLGCGVAAAISASFNAPIAGVLFAHEVVLGHYAMRAFVPVVISSVAGGILSRLWFGDFAAFSIPQYQITSLWEFPAFALLGAACALVAIAFQASLMAADYAARHVEMPNWLRPAAGGVLVGAIALAFPEVLGVGYEATDRALTTQISLSAMLTLLLAKTAATAITLASRFGGGVFSPSLYLGAMTGGAFGIVAASVFPDMASSQGLYAILGMGAVAAAVLGAPVSTAVMVFELTGGYALSIALLLTISIATGIVNALHGHSFFHWQLRMRGVFLQQGPQWEAGRSCRVRDFMTPAAPEDAQPDLDLPRLSPDETLEHALRRFDQGGHARLPVADPADPSAVLGWASQVHALRHFNKALIEATEEEHKA
jgi:CIC family chloride channel protein